MPMCVHDNILRGILWCEEGGGITETGAERKATINTNTNLWTLGKNAHILSPSLSVYLTQTLVYQSLGFSTLFK